MVQSSFYFSGGANQGPRIEYPIYNSLRFRPGNYMWKQYDQGFFGTFAPQWGSGNISFWTKYGATNHGNSGILYAGSCKNMNVHDKLYMTYGDNSGGGLYYREDNDGGNWAGHNVSGLFGDPAGWYHIVIGWNHTSGAKVTVHVNGELRMDVVPRIGQVRFAGDNSCGPYSIMTMGKRHRDNPGGEEWVDASISDLYCVSSSDATTGQHPIERFGFFNEQGIWQPKDPEFTYDEYGATGFHLTFDPTQDPDPQVGIGIDSSGRDNHWGASDSFQLDDETLWSYDVLSDGPTHNENKWNDMMPAVVSPGNNNEYSNKLQNSSYRLRPGSTTTTGSGQGFPQNTQPTVQPGPGSKLFYQFNLQTSIPSIYWNYPSIGFSPRPYKDPGGNYSNGIAFTFRTNLNGDANSVKRKTWMQVNNPDLETPIVEWPQLPGEPTDADGNPATIEYTETEGGLWCGVFYEYDSGDIWFLTNNNSQWSADNWEPKILKPDGTYVDYTGVLPEDCKFNFPEAQIWVYRYTSASNAGGTRMIQSANAWDLLEGSLPAGFKHAQEVSSLPRKPITRSDEHFKILSYVGDGVDGRMMDCGFTPDLVIIKNISANGGWSVFDSIRGPGNFFFIEWGLDYGEEKPGAVDMLQSFVPNGFVLGDNIIVNQDGTQTQAYCWKGGGPAVTNNDGTIQSQVSANPDGGFSVVSYTGTGVSGTIGHGLSEAPSMIWIKSEKKTPWTIYTKVQPADKYFTFEQDTGRHNNIDATVFNDTDSDDTTFSVGTNAYTNEAGTEYIVYCFNEIPGYTQCGSYIGNGSGDGPFISTDFNPLMFLCTDMSYPASWHGWYLFDRGVNPNNPRDRAMIFNQYAPADSGIEKVVFFSNGVKHYTNYAGGNGSGQWKFYFAWGLHPTGGANCYPATGQ